MCVCVNICIYTCILHIYRANPMGKFLALSASANFVFLLPHEVLILIVRVGVDPYINVCIVCIHIGLNQWGGRCLVLPTSVSFGFLLPLEVL